MKTLLILLMMANAADAGLTMRNRGRYGFHEENPVMRPLFQNRASVGIAFSAGSLAQALAVRRYGPRHRKLALAGLSGMLASEAWGIETSAHGPRRAR
jgi:hypothetical protein